MIWRTRELQKIRDRTENIIFVRARGFFGLGSGSLTSKPKQNEKNHIARSLLREMTEQDPVITAVANAIGELSQDERSRRERRHRLRMWQRFDAITIRTVPRFKTSSLSGNEWRISARIDFEKKGRTIYSCSAGTVEGAVTNLGEILRSNELFEACSKADVAASCDQEGCNEPWTRTYTLKKSYCATCATPSDHMSYDTRPLVAHFCDRHSDRGDASYEDCNSNYDMDVAAPAPVAAEDKSHSQLIILS
jgi:hypothetical protein